MSQTTDIHRHLIEEGAITALEALDLYGCFRLAARIDELKNQGVKIMAESYKTPGGATIAKYRLANTGQLSLF